MDLKESNSVPSHCNLESTVNVISVYIHVSLTFDFEVHDPIFVACRYNQALIQIWTEYRSIVLNGNKFQDYVIIYFATFISINKSSQEEQNYMFKTLAQQYSHVILPNIISCFHLLAITNTKLYLQCKTY